jgi:hypothetical protein
MIDDSHKIKWKRSARKNLINAIVQIENFDYPTEELRNYMARAKDCIYYWGSDIAGWEKHHSEIQLPPKVEEQQKHLEENQIEYKE